MQQGDTKAGDSKAAEREARLAAQLRDNLRRRKQQARAAVITPAGRGSSEASAAGASDDASCDDGSDTDRRLPKTPAPG